MARQRDNKAGNSSGDKSIKTQKAKQNDDIAGSTKSTNSTGSRASTTTNTSTTSSSNLNAEKAKPKNSKKTSFEEPKKKFVLNKWKTLMGCVCMSVAVYFGYQGYLETRVNTPFDNVKMVTRAGLDDPERYWGSYRPLNYFGMKTRDPHSLVMGLMWYIPSNLGHGGKGRIFLAFFSCHK